MRRVSLLNSRQYRAHVDCGSNSFALGRFTREFS